MPLEGRFSGVHRRPFVRARLVSRRLRIDQRIDFLVDTGADRSMLLERDGRAIGIDYKRLPGNARAGGIAGVTPASREPVLLVFEEESPRRVHVYRLELVIAHPSASSIGLPSLLSRDILNRWHMTYRPIDNRLEFEVASADSTVDLN